MKLRQNQIESFLENPDRKFHLILFHGNSSEGIHQSKNSLLAKLGGQTLLDEMRLVTLSEKDILSDAEILYSEILTKPFFSGPKIVIIENVTEAIFKTVEEIIQRKLTNEDSILVLIGSNLTAKSALRNLVEVQKRSAVTIPIFKRDRTNAEIKSMIETRGLQFIDESCLTYLKELSESSDGQILINTLDKLQLCFLNENIRLNIEHIESIQDEQISQSYYLIVENVANANLAKTIKEFRKYAIGQQNFSGLVAFLIRYFRNIKNMRANNNLKAPYFGKTQEKFLKHVEMWQIQKVEKVLGLLFNLNIKLRNTGHINNKLKVERALMNICSFIN